MRGVGILLVGKRIAQDGGDESNHRLDHHQRRGLPTGEATQLKKKKAPAKKADEAAAETPAEEKTEATEAVVEAAAEAPAEAAAESAEPAAE